MQTMLFILIMIFILTSCNNGSGSIDTEQKTSIDQQMKTVKIEQPLSKETQSIEDYRAFINKGIELWHVPGVAAAIVSSDSIEFQKGFGSTAIKDGSAINQHTLFAIASTTKAMVVSGILILVDEGKLSLDDLVIKHIPELHFQDPSLTQQITIRDILAHRTGLPSTDVWAFFQDLSLDQQIKKLRMVKPIAAVRTRMIYQNTMFELAGLIIERVSEKKWDKFLTERLWSPIGMKETYGNRAQIPSSKSHVLPYYYSEDKLVQAEWSLTPEHVDAAGSVWSSIHNMSLWAQFLLRGAKTIDGKQLISDKSVAEMFTPHQLASNADFYPITKFTKPNWRSYGLGWFQQDFQGRKIDFHTGSLAGLVAIIGLDRANNKAAIMLANRDHAEMRHAFLWKTMDNRAENDQIDWNQDVFELYQKSHQDGVDYQKKFDQARLQNTKPSLPLENYTGTYNNEAIGDFVIELKDQKLSFKTVMKTFPMTHWHLDTFAIEKKVWNFRGFINFKIDTKGKVNSMEVFEKKFNKIEEK